MSQIFEETFGEKKIAPELLKLLKKPPGTLMTKADVYKCLIAKHCYLPGDKVIMKPSLSKLTTQKAKDRGSPIWMIDFCCYIAPLIDIE
jgi:hypothetical protein